jgi:charged multivesicular body protein 2B
MCVAVNDTLDDMLTESGDEEEGGKVLQQVLDEIGIEISGKVAAAPAPHRGTLGESSKSQLPTDEEIEAQLAKLKS